MDEGQGREPTKAIVIITVWKQSLKSYIEAKKDVEVKRPEKCPACGGRDIIFWSGYFRYVVLSDATSKKLFIRRVYCRSCNKTHSLLPWFVLVKRVYLASLIGDVLTSKIIKGISTRSIAKDLGLSRRTIRGWIKRFESQVENLYNNMLYLIRSAQNHPPPAEDKPSQAITGLFKLFCQTPFPKTHDYFWAYISLLSKGRFLTNTTSPLCNR